VRTTSLLVAEQCNFQKVGAVHPPELAAMKVTVEVVQNLKEFSFFIIFLFDFTQEFKQNTEEGLGEVEEVRKEERGGRPGWCGQEGFVDFTRQLRILRCITGRMVLQQEKHHPSSYEKRRCRVKTTPHILPSDQPKTAPKFEFYRR